MDISWNNIDNLDDYFITYLLYTESKTVSQISKIRNISVTEVNDHLIRAKLDIKSVNKAKVESSKDVLDKFLELGKDARLEFIDELSLDKEKELNFKRELYKRILKDVYKRQFQNHLYCIKKQHKMVSRKRNTI